LAPARSLQAKRKAKRSTATAPTSNANSSPLIRQKTSESKVAFMVFVISVAFVIFELPSAILYCWETLAFLIFRQPRPTWFPAAAFFSNQLVTVNKALNFALYCGAGQHFRHKFLKLFCARFPFKRFYYGSRQNSRFNFSGVHEVGTAGSSSVRASPSRVQLNRRTISTASHVYTNSPKHRDLSLTTSGAAVI